MLSTRLASSWHCRSLSTRLAGRALYNFAIARELPVSFANALSKHAHHKGVPSSLNLDLARHQHNDYLTALRAILPTLCLPPLEDYPDSVFVEDTVVAIGLRAVLTQPGHASRRGEVDSVRTILLQLGMDVVDMVEIEDKARCDGGDVLWTGRHLFVGISDRTNHDSADVLSEALGVDAILVPPVVQGDQVLHLKSAVTHIDDSTLLVPVGSAGDKLLEAMQSKERGYDAIRLPDLLSCNCVSVNGCVLAQESDCDVSRRVLEVAARERDLELDFVNTSEMAKKDGALTCCSVLLTL